MWKPIFVKKKYYFYTKTKFWSVDTVNYINTQTHTYKESYECVCVCVYIYIYLSVHVYVYIFTEI